MKKEDRMPAQQTDIAKDIAKLDDIEQKIICLAPLQAELRRTAQAYLDAHQGLTVSAFAIQAQGTWTDVTEFLAGKRALKEGRFLVGLTTLLNRPDLKRQIEGISKEIQDRQTSVSLFSEPVIRTLFKVLKGYERRKKAITRVIFSNAFTPHHEIVLKLFDLGHIALLALEDTEVREYIDMLIDDDALLDTEIEARIRQQSTRMTELVRTLERITHKLLPYYEGEYKKLARALQVPETTYQEARHGQRLSENKMIEIIEKSRRLAENHGISIELVPAVQELRKPETVIAQQPHTEKHPEITQPSPHTDPLDLDGAGGVTSADGVRHCITTNQLNTLSIQDAHQYIAWTRAALERARWAMNVGTKIKDPVMREEIRQALSKDMRELYLSLQAFEVEFPGEIAPLLEAQRTSFLAR